MPQNVGNAFEETQIFKISWESMPPDPAWSSPLTALAKDFQYLSAYFSNSAIYSISYWKPWGNTFCRSQEHEFIKGDGTTTTFDTESWIKPILAEVDESTS